MAQSECYFFFAPVSQISRTDDRKKENKTERKRIAVVHATFVFAGNRHYLAHFTHNGFGDAILARRYCAYNGMEFMARDNAYNGMTFVSLNMRYDVGDFAYRYCAFGDADFAARYITYGDAPFGVRHMRFKPGAFHGALFAL